jgi:HEAT repeat protein
MNNVENIEKKDYDFVVKNFKKLSSAGVFGMLFLDGKLNKTIDNPKYWKHLIKALKDPDVEIRQNVALWIRGINNKAIVIEPLVEALKDTDAIVRKRAADTLGEIGDSKAVIIDSLIEALKDSNFDVRVYAAESLGKLGDPRALSALQALLDYTDEYLRNKEIKNPDDDYFRDKINISISKLQEKN